MCRVAEQQAGAVARYSNDAQRTLLFGAVDRRRRRTAKAKTANYLLDIYEEHGWYTSID